MSRIAFIFPGQGSQAVGMGKELADAFPAAKAVFDEVDAALGENLSKLIWEGPIETLTLTANTQPALMAVSLAAVRALESGFGVKISQAAFVAGHSLGEYSALAAAGALSITDAAKLLRRRGEAMQAAAPAGTGAMAALIGKVDVEIAEIIALEGSAAGHGRGRQRQQHRQRRDLRHEGRRRSRHRGRQGQGREGDLAAGLRARSTRR